MYRKTYYSDYEISTATMKIVKMVEKLLRYYSTIMMNGNFEVQLRILLLVFLEIFMW